MKKLTLALVLALLFCFGCSKKQPEKKKEQIATVTTTPAALTEEERSEQQYQIYRREKIAVAVKETRVSTAPGIVGHTGTDLNWEEALAGGLYYWKHETDTYGSEQHFLSFQGPLGGLSSFKQVDNLRAKYGEYRRKVFIAYALFQNGNSYVNPQNLLAAAGKIFRSDRSRELTYAWALPHIKRTFTQIPAKDRADHMKIFRHAEKYLAEADMAREENYLASLVGNTCRSATWQKEYYTQPEWFLKWTHYDCQSLFKWLGPDGGEETGFRKLEAMIFRRIKGGWSREKMLAMTQRLIADLEPLM